MKRSISVIAVLWLIALSACSIGKTPTPRAAEIGIQNLVALGSHQDVSAADLHLMLENKDFVLVNVHIPFEGNISNTDLSLPYNQIAQYLDKLPDKDVKIVLYCRSGRMSAIAAETLVNLGYTNVWNLSGGMSGWENAGFMIEH